MYNIQFRVPHDLDFFRTEMQLDSGDIGLFITLIPKDL